MTINRAKVFMAELVSLTRPHEGWRDVRVRAGRDLCDCYVDVRATGEDTVYLNQIAARPGCLGEGRGTEALKVLCELADKHCLNIYGYPCVHVRKARWRLED